jgi:hypothetical protein
VDVRVRRDAGATRARDLHLHEHDGRTTLVSVALFDSIESRDAAIESGMEKGAAETWDRLEELLGSLQRARSSRR